MGWPMGNTIVLDQMGVKHESAMKRQNFDLTFGQMAGWQCSGLAGFGVAFLSFGYALNLSFAGVRKIKIGMDQVVDTL